MPNANERRALWFLALVALSGSVVRLARARHPDRATVDAGLARQIARVDSARERRVGPRPGPRPRTPSPDRSAPNPEVDASHPAPYTPHPDLVDINRASARELEGLPGIGPSLAQRIVAHRDSAGAFRSLTALCAVRGIGPATAERLRPLIVFSGERPGRATCPDAPGRRGKGRASQPRTPR